MKYVSVKNIGQYKLPYKDRAIRKICLPLSMLHADPNFEMLGEVDKWRLVQFIAMQLESGKPTPLDNAYLQRKGFDLKTRPISITCNMLHNFLSCVTEDEKLCNIIQSKELEQKQQGQISSLSSLSPTPPISPISSTIPTHSNIVTKGEKKKHTHTQANSIQDTNMNTNNVIRDEFKEFLGQVKSVWNEMTANLPIPQINHITSERRKHLRQRYASTNFRKGWLSSMLTIRETPFLQGKNKRGWVADFDWFIANDTNWVKILEGRYGDLNKNDLLQKFGLTEK